jgi:endonuclease-3 related protein
MKNRLDDHSLHSVYRQLLGHHGRQGWWPANSRFEVMVGAVLTQNTAWRNVEKAIIALQEADALDPRTILALPSTVLAGLLRPSGYFNVKARRLKALCRWLLDAGGLVALAEQETGGLRAELLAVNGVGPETADDILLYALDRRVFVIDAYTRRIFSRMGIIAGDEKYEFLRDMFESDLPGGAEEFNEYHALIVRHAVYVCRPTPRCENCCLRAQCQEVNRAV